MVEICPECKYLQNQSDHYEHMALKYLTMTSATPEGLHGKIAYAQVYATLASMAVVREHCHTH